MYRDWFIKLIILIIYTYIKITSLLFHNDDVDIENHQKFSVRRGLNIQYIKPPHHVALLNYMNFILNLCWPSSNKFFFFFFFNIS